MSGLVLVLLVLLVLLRGRLVQCSDGGDGGGGGPVSPFHERKEGARELRRREVARGAVKRTVRPSLSSGWREVQPRHAHLPPAGATEVADESHPSEAAVAARGGVERKLDELVHARPVLLELRAGTRRGNE